VEHVGKRGIKRADRGRRNTVREGRKGWRLVSLNAPSSKKKKKERERGKGEGKKGWNKR